MSDAAAIDGLLRELAPRTLGALLRRFGRFDACEDAVQEALLEAALRWREDGVPERPAGWLVTVASRRMVDDLRSERARRRREASVAALEPRDAAVAPAPGEAAAGDADDTLRLLVLCCHPALTPTSQAALTLRAAGGLTTAEIARAFLVPEAAMAKRIARAKADVRAAGATFELPPEPELSRRLDVVLHVLYLVFNEGYSATTGPDLQRPDLTTEALRLTRLVHRLLPGHGEAAGLLALMLLTDARRDARLGPHGELVPLLEQDRGRWDAAAIGEATRLLAATLPRSRMGPFQVQAAIAAVHAEAATAEQTDWPQILALYDLLERMAPNPVITLGRAVAVAMVRGPREALALLETIPVDRRPATGPRVEGVRAHLLEMAGDAAAAHAAYREAARRTTSLPERRHLEARADRLAEV